MPGPAWRSSTFTAEAGAGVGMPVGAAGRAQAGQTHVEIVSHQYLDHLEEDKVRR